MPGFSKNREGLFSHLEIHSSLHRFLFLRLLEKGFASETPGHGKTNKSETLCSQLCLHFICLGKVYDIIVETKLTPKKRRRGEGKLFPNSRFLSINNHWHANSNLPGEEKILVRA